MCPARQAALVSREGRRARSPDSCRAGWVTAGRGLSRRPEGGSGTWTASGSSGSRNLRVGQRCPRLGAQSLPPTPRNAGRNLTCSQGRLCRDGRIHRGGCNGVEARLSGAMAQGGMEVLPGTRADTELSGVLGLLEGRPTAACWAKLGALAGEASGELGRRSSPARLGRCGVWVAGNTGALFTHGRFPAGVWTPALSPLTTAQGFMHRARAGAWPRAPEGQTGPRGRWGPHHLRDAPAVTSLVGWGCLFLLLFLNFLLELFQPHFEKKVPKLPICLTQAYSPTTSAPPPRGWDVCYHRWTESGFLSTGPAGTPPDPTPPPGADKATQGLT